jgi:hypothetical protein
VSLRRRSLKSLSMGHQHAILVIGGHRQIVVLGLSRKARLIRSPAIVAFIDEHPADTGRDILIKEEPHGEVALGSVVRAKMHQPPAYGQPRCQPVSATGTPQ